MTGKVLECPDCFGRWETVEEAEEHAKHAKHLNFFESDGPVLRLVCTTCGKNCRSTIQRDLHKFWTGHDEYVDMPLQAAAPLILEAPTLATKTEQMRQCLQFIKQSHVADYDKVKVAFTTLLTFARNVALYPDDEKYRKIRITNDKFQERVGKLKGGIEFLELCGFEKLKDSPHLFMPREKVDKALLTAAGTELNNAINDPFFGFL